MIDKTNRKTEDRVTPIPIPSEVEDGQALQWPKET